MVKFPVLCAAFALSLCALVHGSLKQTEVRYTVVQQGDFSGVKKPGYAIVRSEGALDAFLKKHQELNPALFEGTDWKTSEYLIVFGGQEQSTGYSVDVTRITEERQNDWVVEARLNSPAPGGIVNPAIATPYEVILTSRHKGKTTLRWITQ